MFTKADKGNATVAIRKTDYYKKNGGNAFGQKTLMIE